MHMLLNLLLVHRCMYVCMCACEIRTHTYTHMHLCSTQTCMCVLAPKLYKDCKDVLQTTDDSLLPAGCFGLNATSLANRRRNSNIDIWRMADTLQQMAADGQSYSEMEKLTGLVYNPLGIIYDLSLRHVHKPINSYIRDWMHILVSGGVANSQMIGLKDALKEAGVPMSAVRDYSVQWTLPKQHGKVSPTWLDDARFEGDSFSSFASYLLTLIPIIGAFLVDNVRPHNVIEDHIECFLLLGMIIGLLSSGADFACQHLTLLAEYIVKHHKLYVRLYPGSKLIKTKFHQLLHLPETYQRLKKVLSCFAATTWFVDTV